MVCAPPPIHPSHHDAHVLDGVELGKVARVAPHELLKLQQYTAAVVGGTQVLQAGGMRRSDYS